MKCSTQLRNGLNVFRKAYSTARLVSRAVSICLCLLLSVFFAFQVSANCPSAPNTNIFGPQNVCEQTSGHQYSTVFSAGYTYQWGINGGAITADNGHEIEVKWNNPGSGAVVVIVNDTLTNCDSTGSINVQIEPRPSAQISGQDKVCEHSGNYIYSALHDNDLKYEWNVTGGSFVLQNPNVISVNWADSGMGMVNLTVTDTSGITQCKRSDSLFVEIEQSPTPAISGRTVICAFETGVTYSTDEIQGHLYDWQVQGGTIVADSGHSIIVDWGNAGMGEIILWQSDTSTNNTCAVSDTLLVSVDEQPNPVTNGLETVCAFSGPHIYYVGVHAGYVYNWSLSGGVTQSAGSKIHIFWNDPGNGEVIIEKINATSDSNCTGYDTVNVFIESAPAPEILGDKNVCAFSKGHIYSVNELSDHAYDWYVQGGTIAVDSGSQIIVNWDDTGAGQIVVVKTDMNTFRNCSKSDTLFVTVNSVTSPQISGPEEICKLNAETVYFTDSIPGYSYNWNVSNGTITSDIGHEVAIEWSGDSGKVHVTLINDSTNCQETDSLFVTVKTLTPEISGQENVCPYTSGYIYHGKAVNGHNYNWNISGGSIMSDSGNKVIVEWYAAGIGTLELTQSYPGAHNCDSTVSMSINIDAVPAPYIHGPDTICKNSLDHFSFTDTVPGYQYDWNVQGGTIVNDNGNEIQVSWNNDSIKKVYLTKNDTSITNCNTTVGKQVFTETPPELIVTGPLAVSEQSTGIYTTGLKSGHIYNWSVYNGTIQVNNGHEVEVLWHNSGLGILSVSKTDTTALNKCSKEAIIFVLIGNKDPGTINVDFVCQGSQETYSTTYNNGRDYKWSISGGGDIVNNNNSSIEVLWNDTGLFKVVVIEIDGFSNITSYNIFNVVSEPKPTPSLSGPKYVCNLKKSYFNNSDSINRYNYQWVVNGGTLIQDNGQFAEIQWDGQDSAYVDLIATDTSTVKSCKDTVRFHVNIENPAPQINGPAYVCENSTGETYSTQYKPGHQYNWNVAGGNIISYNGHEIEVYWYDTVGGVITLTETTSNAYSCDSTITFSVLVNPNPEPEINGQDTVCAYSGNHIYYTNYNAGHKYEWSVSGGTIVQESINMVQVYWHQHGVGFLTVKETDTSSNAKCFAISTYEVVIEPKPNALITGPKSVCKHTGGHVYVADSIPGYTYNWNVTGGVITSYNENKIEVNWHDVGLGVITLDLNDTSTVHNCDTTITTEVVIEQFPVPVITGDLIVCENSGGHIYKTDFISGYNYNWNVSGGTIMSQNNNEITVQWNKHDTGIVTVSQAPDSIPSCINTDDLLVAIQKAPEPSITGVDKVCENTGSYLYSVDSVYGHLYVWSIQGGTIIEDNKYNVLVDWGNAGAGKITVVETDTNTVNNCAVAFDLNVLKRSRPNPVTHGPEIVCQYETVTYFTDSLPGMKYEWVIEGGTILSNSDSASHKIFVEWGQDTTGTIKLTLRDTTMKISCDTTIYRNITIEKIPVSDLSGPSKVCKRSGGHIYSTISDSSYAYSWVILGGQITQNNASEIEVYWSDYGAGIISLIQTDTSNKRHCDASEVMSVYRENTPDISILGPERICKPEGELIYSVVDKPGYKYNWQVSGGNVISNDGHEITIKWGEVGTAEIIVAITDTSTSGQCTDADTLNIVINTRPLEPEISGETIVCKGSLQYYSVSGLEDYVYNWEADGGQIISGNGTEEVQVRWNGDDQGQISVSSVNVHTGCETGSLLDVNLSSIEPVSITGKTVVCIDTEALYEIESNQQFVYSWDVVNGEVLTAGDQNTIRVKWTKAGFGKLIAEGVDTVSGCVNRDTLHVEIIEIPEVTIDGKDQLCLFDERYNYSVPYWSNAEYNWNVSGGAIHGNNTDHEIMVTWDGKDGGLVTVEVIRESLCKKVFEKVVEFTPFPGGKPELKSYSGCAPFTPELKHPQGLNIAEMQWEHFSNNTPFEYNKQIVYKEPGTYEPVLNVITDEGCKYTFSYKVEVHEGIQAEFAFGFDSDKDTIFTQAPFEIINNTKNGVGFIWHIDDLDVIETSLPENIEYTINTPGTYQITQHAVNRNGCWDSMSKFLRVRPEEWMYVPNAFSPNDDGINDYFEIESNFIEKFKVIITNRWGEIIFTSNSPDFKWDGRYQGEYVKEGVYVYQIQAWGWSGKRFNTSGTLHLIR